MFGSAFRDLLSPKCVCALSYGGVYLATNTHTHTHRLWLVFSPFDVQLVFREARGAKIDLVQWSMATME